MRCAIVDKKTKIVINVVEANREFVYPKSIVVPSQEATIGDKYLGKDKFEKPKKEVNLQDELKKVKKQFELGGIIVDDIHVETSRESQSMINSMYNFTIKFKNKNIDFKTSGEFVKLTQVQAMKIAECVATHVQECFSIEHECFKKINTGDIKTIEEINEFFLLNLSNKTPQE